jgi:serine/threonine protein kinase
LSAPQTISAQWKDLEGQTVGACTLHAYAGGSDQTAVFTTTRSNGEKAAIKLTPLDARTSELKLSRLRDAMRLSHPNLLPIYDSGVIELQGKNLLWVLSPLADEDLSQILPLRALTPGETDQMLGPVLTALAYLHREGFVHGRVKPSNIMAIGDQVKLSTDSLSVLGDPLLNPLRTAYDAPELRQGRALPGSDLWALGMTIVNALTQSLPTVANGVARIPASLPSRFSGIADRCLQVDIRQRATLGEIQDLLKRPVQAPETGRTVPPAPLVRETTVDRKLPQPAIAEEREKRGINLAWVLPIAAVVLILVGLLWRNNSNNNKVRENASVPAPATVSREAPPPAPDAANHVEPAVSPPAAAEPEPPPPSTPDPASGVVKQVLPPISAGARNTVTGRVRVAIRARVNSEGKVIQTSFDSHGPSDYFARKAKEAAEQWKFAPGVGETVWQVRFGFGRKDTQAGATRLSR